MLGTHPLPERIQPVRCRRGRLADNGCFGFPLTAPGDCAGPAHAAERMVLPGYHPTASVHGMFRLATRTCRAARVGTEHWNPACRQWPRCFAGCRYWWAKDGERPAEHQSLRGMKHCNAREPSVSYRVSLIFVLLVDSGTRCLCVPACEWSRGFESRTHASTASGLAFRHQAPVTAPGRRLRAGLLEVPLEMLPSFAALRFGRVQPTLRYALFLTSPARNPLSVTKPPAAFSYQPRPGDSPGLR